MTTNVADFLVELGCEELPPKSLLAMASAFRDEILHRLDELDLHNAGARYYATPRRLAVKVLALADRTADQHVVRRGPAITAAFDDEGKPTKAALGFAKSCGVALSALGRLKTDKGEWLQFETERPGQSAQALLGDIVASALRALPIAKAMRWGDGETEFIRPVHWLVMLYGTETVTANVLGLTSDAKTFGHRSHYDQAIELCSPDDYPQLLETPGYVIADFEKRRALITSLARTIAAEHEAHAVINEALLDEVTALVEWPVALCGGFDEHFLALPPEVLIASMEDHQKYFPMESPQGRLTNKFITIANIESQDPDVVKRGNERVIRPRLNDADFFWRQDRKQKLADRAPALGGILFEKRLGNLQEKSDRVVRLAGCLAAEFEADQNAVARAAGLSRCDLVTDMVGEFPELQGLVGSYYARADGEAEAIATALREFYLPRFAGDDIPGSAVGRCVAYADKIDTLVGIFSITGAPSGDKDPYGLRRAALGCVRIGVESNASVDFRTSLEQACDGYPADIVNEQTLTTVLTFMLDRLRGYFTARGVPQALVRSVLAVDATAPGDIRRRIDAVSEFIELPDADILASANKRIANILRKSGSGASGVFDAVLLADPAEQALNEAIDKIAAGSTQHLECGDYRAYMLKLATLGPAVNRFFDEVMVMCDDERLRNNRLALLGKLYRMFTRVADLSYMNDS